MLLKVAGCKFGLVLTQAFKSKCKPHIAGFLTAPAILSSHVVGDSFVPLNHGLLYSTQGEVHKCYYPTVKNKMAVTTEGKGIQDSMCI